MPDLIDFSHLPASALIATPPGPALIALALASGVVAIGVWLANRLVKTAGPLEWAAGFITAAAALGALLHGWAFAGGLSLAALRSCAGGLAAIGLIGAFRTRARITHALFIIRREFAGARLFERIGLAAAAAALAALGLAALGPAVDYDSLTYHLAVPLDWLGAGRALPRLDWLLARHVGLGEGHNLLGLAAGTDAFGAVLQFCGALAALTALAAAASSSDGRRLALLWLAASPVLLILIPSQKPYLLPLAGLAVAGALLLRGELDAPRQLLLCMAAVFAFACKLSFLPDAGLLLLAGGWRAHRDGSFTRFCTIAVATLLVLAGPLMLRNWMFYGDPLSPLLEGWKAKPDAALLDYMRYIRGFHPKSWLEFFKLPLRCFVVLPGGDPTYCLGAGALGFGFLWPGLRRREPLASLATASLLTAVAFGPWSVRFFLSAYLWLGLLAAKAAPSRASGLLGRLLSAQALLLLPLALWLAAGRFPGAVNGVARAATLEKLARGANEARWLNATIPPDRTLIAGRISTFLFERSLDPAFDINQGPAMTRLSHLARHLRAGARVIVVQTPHEPDDPAALAAPHCGTPVGASAQVRIERIFRPAGAPVSLQLYATDPDAPDCAAWLEAATAHNGIPPR